jgi:hypothetical protein
MIMKWSLLLLFAACDSSTPNNTAGGSYAVAATLNANTAQATSLIFTTKSLDAKATVDESAGISVPDVVTIYGIEGAGKVYSTQAMSPVVTEYLIDDKGKITPGRSISFQQFGLAGSFSTRAIAMISPTKAYLLDDTTLQAITFNPQEMTVGKAISLSGMMEPNYGTNFSYTVPVRGKQVVVTGYHYNATFSGTIATTHVAFIDGDTDAVTTIKDTRCGDFSSIATAPNGDLYFGADTYSTALNLAGGSTVAPEGCILRMKSGENQFDANFFVKIKDITGLPGGGAVPGNGNAIWTRAFDTSMFPITMGTTTAGQIHKALAWKWYKIDLANPTAMATAATVDPSGGQLNYSIVGKTSYVVNPTTDTMGTVLLDMTSNTAPTLAATMQGRTKSIVKAR